MMYSFHLNVHLLFGGKEFVERSGRGHLHDQHKTVCVAQAEHADYEGVTQLVHDLCLPHHLLLHQLLVFILQHFYSHVYLTPETKQKRRWDQYKERSMHTHYEARAPQFMLFFTIFGSSRFCFEDSLLDAAKVPRAELHLIHQEVRPLDVEPFDVVGVVIWIESTAVHGEKITAFRQRCSSL